jgi:hypothetical protein
VVVLTITLEVTRDGVKTRGFAFGRGSFEAGALTLGRVLTDGGSQGGYWWGGETQPANSTQTIASRALISFSSTRRY